MPKTISNIQSTLQEAHVITSLYLYKLFNQAFPTLITSNQKVSYTETTDSNEIITIQSQLNATSNLAPPFVSYTLTDKDLNPHGSLNTPTKETVQLTDGDGNLTGDFITVKQIKLKYQVIFYSSTRPLLDLLDEYLLFSSMEGRVSQKILYHSDVLNCQLETSIQIMDMPDRDNRPNPRSADSGGELYTTSFNILVDAYIGLKGSAPIIKEIILTQKDMNSIDIYNTAVIKK